MRPLPRLRRVIALVVEEQLESRESLRESLEAIGVTVLTAGSGAEGLRIVQQVLPTVIMADLSIPEGEGGWLAAELGKLPYGSLVPFVGLSRRSLPADPREYPTAVAQGLTALRLAGVAGPYRLLLSADAYTAVAETADHGYPVREHVARVLGQGSEIIWAPAIEGALLLSARGGDFELHLGQDVSIGYLSHDASSVELYFEESLTFLVQTPEAAVSLG